MTKSYALLFLMICTRVNHYTSKKQQHITCEKCISCMWSTQYSGIGFLLHSAQIRLLFCYYTIEAFADYLCQCWPYMPICRGYSQLQSLMIETLNSWKFSVYF
jgi:hypothetical protein